MNIFNSLGSNYNLAYIAKSLITIGSKNDSNRLKTLLEKKYGGKAFLFYKGREALTLAIKTINLPKKSLIAINGFTCVAVFNAIRKAGLEPLCLDLDKTGNLNFTAKALEVALKTKINIKAVVVQNTFGYPCDIEEIEQICKKNNLVLIEDLAHCIGTKYKDGREAGTVGDFIVLSFSQDKIIDAVSGGALIVTNKKFLKINPEGFKLINPEGFKLRDRIYPLETYKIRLTYTFGLGKPYHFLLKRLNLLSNVMNESFYEYYLLPNWNAAIALYQFKLLKKQLEHRKKIAEIYVSNLPDKIFMFDKDKTREAVPLSTNLRFPIFIEKNRSGLVKKLKEHGVFLADIWYTDVAPDCPNAVYTSKIILNLPTHINVSESDAQRICKIINNFIEKKGFEARQPGGLIRFLNVL